MYTANQAVFPVIDLAGTGRSIERHRRQAGLTVRDLQTYFGFEYPQAIYKWQHGECLPTVDNLLALARLLRVSMEDLLVYEDREVQPVFGASGPPSSRPVPIPAAVLRRFLLFPSRFLSPGRLSFAFLSLDFFFLFLIRYIS